MRKRSSWVFGARGIGVALLITTVLLLGIKHIKLFNYDSGSIDTKAVGQAVLSITERVNQLWKLAQHSGGKSFEMKMIMQGSYPLTSSDWKQEAVKWKEQIHVATPFIAKEERGQEVLRSDYQGPDWKREILVFTEQDRRLYYTIHLTGQEQSGKEHIAGEGENIYEALQANHSPVLWNSEIRTKVAGKKNVLWERMLHKMQKLGEIKPIDNYEDNGTRSISYETSYMGEGIKMKNGIANLQMAVHEIPAAGITRLTLGIPLISGEY